MNTFEAVHALALRLKADLPTLQASTGTDASTLEAALAPAVADGYVIPARGLYVLAPKGATWLQERYPQEFAAQRADTQLMAEYGRFEVINRELKSLITQWQSMSVGGKQVPNDHSDAVHDGRILDRLASLHERAEALLARMAARLPRLGRYATRLGDALDRALNGEHEWVSGIRCDSYHTVWFEMHEDLLRLLGLKREE
ncbi:MAG: hypothetical protein ACT4QA_10405 [Panacagrimonas sp.]